MRSLWQFLCALWDDWIAVMSGVASVLFSVVGAVYGTPGLPSWTFWVVAGVCLLIAAFRVWQKERRALETCLQKQTSSVRARREETRVQFGKLRGDQKKLLGQLHVKGGMTEPQIIDYFRTQGIADQKIVISLIRSLSEKTDFLEHTFEGRWTIKHIFQEHLDELLK